MQMSGKRVDGEPAASLYFSRHFGLLACILAVLAATAPWRPAFSAVTWFGFYGALHAAAVVLTWRGRGPTWRRLGFVVTAILLSMLSSAVSLYLTRHSARLAAMGPALPLALSSGLGAATYVVCFRWLGAVLPRVAYVLLPALCMVATEAMLAGGMYGYGGGLVFAAAWWMAFSLGLWFLQGRGRGNPLP